MSEPTPIASISIVIPAYNEARRLPSTLDTILGYVSARGWEEAEVIVVDDGSTDGTAALAERTGDRRSKVRVIREPVNRGKGAAVRRGALEARHELVLVTDADLSTPIEEVERLNRCLFESRADVAIGSRAVVGSVIDRHQPAIRELAGKTFNLVARLVTGLPLRDTQCGFKLFTAKAAREIFARQRLDGFGFDVESLFIARRLGFSVVEVPVRWSNAPGTAVTLARGLDAFVDVLRVRWHAVRGRY